MKITSAFCTTSFLVLFFLCYTQAVTQHSQHSIAHKRYVKANPGKAFHVKDGPKAFKRYVIPKFKHPQLKSETAKDFKARRAAIDSTFQHSSTQVKLKRAAEEPLHVVEKRNIHPLLYWTQHYNRALGRTVKATSQQGVQKRAVDQHLESSAQRMQKRWQSLFGDTQTIKLRQKRHVLVG